MNIANSGSLQIVTTPTIDWLGEYAQACSSRMLICSPYVNNGIIGLTNQASESVSRTLVTKTDLRDFAIGASNLDTLCTLAREGVAIRSLNNLHAKIYIFDESAALITSANATISGLNHNIECGIGTDDRAVVKQLAESLLSGFGTGEPPCHIGADELESLHIPLEAIKATIPKPPRETSSQGDAPVAEAEFSISDREALLKGFNGWQKLTLRGVLNMPEDGFGLQELLDVCQPAAAVEYPDNHNVRPKLRQQLQMLRDLGLVEFVGRGRYKRTMS